MARRTALLLSVGVLAALLAAPAASGQAALDQYVPKLEPGKRKKAKPISQGGGVEPAVPAETGSRPQPADTSEGESGGGTLPGSDFPLTPFLLLLLLLLLAALIAREVWKRLRGEPESTA